MYVNVKIDSDDLIEMLIGQLELWTHDKQTIDLYTQMYVRELEGGVFENAEFNPAVIVDNDYVNYCSIVEEGEEDYSDILEVYEKEGLGAWKSYSIEAISDDKKAILIRW